MCHMLNKIRVGRSEIILFYFFLCWMVRGALRRRPIVWTISRLRISLRFRCDITETPNRPSLSICGVLTLRYGRGKHVSANHE